MNNQLLNNSSPIQGAAAIRYIEDNLNCPEEVLSIFPKFFLIETVNVCNAKCIMCGINFSKKKKAIMQKYLFDKITDEISQHRDHVEKVMLYLDGEPLLDKTLHLKIKQMKEKGVRKVNIATNASLLDNRKGIELIEAGLDEIYITIDSLNQRTFEAIRTGLKFKTVYENTLKFIRLRNRLNKDLSIRIQMILQESNFHETGFFTQHWTRLLEKNDQIAVQRAHNWASSVSVMKFGDEERANEIPCIALWGTMCIHVDGSIGLCCMDTDCSILLGNIKDQTITSIWQGGKLRKVREKHLYGARKNISLCDGCTLWRESKRDLMRVLGDD